MKLPWLTMQGAAILVFGTWLYFRGQIWGNTELFPSEMVGIYTRDSSSFFLALRIVFLAAAGWGVVLFWRSGRLFYIALPFLWFPVLLGLDSLLITLAMGRVARVNTELVPDLPLLYYHGLIEALATVLLGLVVMAILGTYYQNHRRARHFAPGV
ncbi:MAG: hypothetical protein KDC54_10110 [Lewinella sp.]|nr:hypothetical protein [Lewinella sp.]